MARTLGVICARGGSKGLPGKNLMEVDGKSMLQRSIEQARGSKLLTRWVVSTDNEAIAEVAKVHDKDCVPFMRPREYAQDDTRIEYALTHALEFCEDEEGEEYDFICMLLNTMPLRESVDIDVCIGMMEDIADSVVSGYWIEHPYELRFSPRQLSHGEYCSWDDNRAIRGFNRQMVASVFLGNGAVVVTRRSCLAEKRTIWGEPSLLYPMPMWRSIDVDDADDLRAVECILRGERYALPDM